MARVVFMGAPEFAVPTLQALVDAGHEVVAAYSQPPRPAGRGKKLRETPAHAAATDLGLDVRTPKSFRVDGAVEAFAALEADVAVVVAYGLLLPQAVLDAPRWGCLNLHASLLPRWRGAAPIQRAVMAGDAETGAGVMQMTLGLDEGPVLAELRTPIAPDDTSGSLHARLSVDGAALMVETLDAVVAGRAKPTPQAADGVVYASKIDKVEAAIDWTRSAAALDRTVRGLSPSPGAWFPLDGQDRIKVLLTRPETPVAVGPPGALLDADGLVACGDGALRILRAQRSGRGPSDGADVLARAKLGPGDVLASAV